MLLANKVRKEHIAGHAAHATPLANAPRCLEHSSREELEALMRDAIRCTQLPSVAIRCHQRDQLEALMRDAIRCTQLPSVAIRCHQRDQLRARHVP